MKPSPLPIPPPARGEPVVDVGDMTSNLELVNGVGDWAVAVVFNCGL